MTGREGEGDGGEVPEAREETLEDYRAEINKRYDEGGEQDVSNSAEKDQTDESVGRGDSDGAGSKEAASADGGDASKGQIEQMRESRHETSEENPRREGAEPEGRESPGKTAADDLYSMRERLNKKYPEDDREMERGDGATLTAQKESGERLEVDSSAVKTGELGKGATSETKTETPTNGVETFDRNPRAPAGNEDATNEDVGWKNVDDLRERPKEGDSLDSRNPSDQESRRPEGRGSEAAKSKSSDSKLSFAGQEAPGPWGEAKGGGNHPPEHDRPMSDKDGGQDGHKDGNHEGEEGSEQPPIVRKASKYMASLALIIPDRAIPKHESGDDVYEVRISRVSKPEKQYTVYMTHNPANDRAHLPIKQVDAEKGEEFYVRRPERYEGKDFARDYNASKPKALENTSLEWRDDKFILKVDEAEFALREPKLRAQEGKAVLDVKLNDEGKNAVKIAKGIDGTEFRLNRDHAIVTSMKEGRDGIVMTYQRTKNDVPPHARLIATGQPERKELAEWKHEFKIGVEEGSLDRTIDTKRDVIPAHFSDEARIRAATYWASHETHAEKWHQGDIGEEVARRLLEKSGFRTISEHTNPNEARIPIHKSERAGMDGVVERDGKYYVVQVKHWLEPQKALDNARKDLEAFGKGSARSRVEAELGGYLEGGLAIEVSWSYRSQEAVIYTDYIKF